MERRTKEQRDKVVDEFAESMKAQLDANNYKDDWSGEGQFYLFVMLSKEAGRIAHSFVHGLSRESLRKICANVANYAMMIADKI